MTRRVLSHALMALVMVLCGSRVFAVSCGSTTTDSRFMAVCELAPRPIHEWCRGDVNFDGVVDMDDEDVVDGLDGLIDGAMWTPYRCYQGAPGCAPPGACP